MEQGPGTTVLVTGGSGYLGGWCVVELLRRGYRVRTTVRDLGRERELRDVLAAEAGPAAVAERLSVVAADLTADPGWAEAVAGCDFVLHVASPLPETEPKDARELIEPARAGTLRVLRASLAAGVNRVVVTSSSAAATYRAESSPNPVTEADWTDLGHPLARPYVRSKVIAERAAWDVMREHQAEHRLATVLPGAILGPVFSRDFSYSVQIVERLVRRQMPGLPRLGFPLVDVRDVADLQIRAMTAPEAAGQRFLATTGFRWLADIAGTLRDGLGAAGARVPTRELPSVLVRGVALFDPGLRQVVAELGQRFDCSSEKARTLLGWSPRPLDETILDCARSLLGESGAGAA